MSHCSGGSYDFILNPHYVNDTFETRKSDYVVGRVSFSVTRHKALEHIPLRIYHLQIFLSLKHTDHNKSLWVLVMVPRMKYNKTLKSTTVRAPERK